MCALTQLIKLSVSRSEIINDCNFGFPKKVHHLQKWLISHMEREQLMKIFRAQADSISEDITLYFDFYSDESMFYQ